MPKVAAKGKGKRYPLNMRTTKEVRDKLERAAAASGRSLVQEVERRIEQSFREEEVARAMGVGEEAQSLSRPITFYLGMLQLRGISWRDYSSDVRKGISLIVDAVSTNGLSNEAAEEFLIGVSQYGQHQREVQTTAYALLQAAGLAPDPSSLELPVKK